LNLLLKIELDKVEGQVCHRYQNKKRVLSGFIFFFVIAGYLAFIFEPALKFELDKVEGHC
jgi:hypothetical protein